MSSFSLCIAHVMVKRTSFIFQRKNILIPQQDVVLLLLGMKYSIKNWSLHTKIKLLTFFWGEQVFTVHPRPNSLFNGILDPACYKNNPEWFKNYQTDFKNQEEIRYSVFSPTAVHRKSNPMLTNERALSGSSLAGRIYNIYLAKHDKILLCKIFTRRSGWSCRNPPSPKHLTLLLLSCPKSPGLGKVEVIFTDRSLHSLVVGAHVHLAT